MKWTPPPSPASVAFTGGLDLPLVRPCHLCPPIAHHAPATHQQHKPDLMGPKLSGAALRWALGLGCGDTFAFSGTSYTSSHCSSWAGLTPSPAPNTLLPPCFSLSTSAWESAQLLVRIVCEAQVPGPQGPRVPGQHSCCPCGLCLSVPVHQTPAALETLLPGRELRSVPSSSPGPGKGALHQRSPCLLPAGRAFNPTLCA